MLLHTSTIIFIHQTWTALEAALAVVELIGLRLVLLLNFIDSACSCGLETDVIRLSNFS